MISSHQPAKTSNIYNLFITVRTFGAKFSVQKGNSPEHKLRFLTSHKLSAKKLFYNPDLSGS